MLVGFSLEHKKYWEIKISWGKMSNTFLPQAQFFIWSNKKQSAHILKGKLWSILVGVSLCSCVCVIHLKHALITAEVRWRQSQSRCTLVSRLSILLPSWPWNTFQCKEISAIVLVTTFWTDFDNKLGCRLQKKKVH